MLDENMRKPELHLVLDQIAASHVCFVKLNINLEEKSIGSENTDSKNIDQQAQDIFNALNAAIEDKTKELNKTISAYECERFMSMSIPVVFLTAIPSHLSGNVDKHLKSKGYVWGNRVVIKFERIQPECQLKVEERPHTPGRNSIFFNDKRSDILPANQECVEPESKLKINQELPVKPLQSVAKLEAETSPRYDSPSRSSSRSPSLSQSRCSSSSSRSSSLSPSRSSSRTPSPSRSHDSSSNNQSEFFKSNDSDKSKAGKGFGLPKFGIFKKHHEGHKKIENLPEIFKSSSTL